MIQYNVQERIKFKKLPVVIMADKDKVKVKLEWPITQAIVTQLRNGLGVKSDLIHARKRGCGKKLTFQVELSHPRSDYGGWGEDDYSNEEDVYCNLYLVKGDYATVSWGLEGYGTDQVNFTPTSIKYQRYSCTTMPITPASTLVFFLEVTSSDWKQGERSTESLKTDLAKLLQSGDLGDLSDVTLVCNNVEFKCHKSILGARSTVFRTMLSPNSRFKEGQIKGLCKIDIKEAEPAALENFLAFLYGGDFDQDDMELTLEVLELAERYDVPALKEVCSECLVDGLSSSNYWQCLKRCVMLNVPDLVKETLRKAVEDPKDLRDNKEWLQLVKTYPELTLTILDVVQEKLKK